MDNVATVGRIKTALTQETEAQMKSAVKTKPVTKARKTNNQASFQWRQPPTSKEQYEDGCCCYAAGEASGPYRFQDASSLHKFAHQLCKQMFLSTFVCSSILFTPDLHQIYTRFVLFTLNLPIVYSATSGNSENSHWLLSV